MAMTLGELISELEKHDTHKRVRHGFGEGASYRGYYEQLAFEPKENVLVIDMLQHARRCVGVTMQGYKGGSFEMDESSLVHIAEWGCSSGDDDHLCIYRLREMLNDEVTDGDA